MYTHVDCIALRTIRVSDSRALLSAWTRQLGRVTIGMPAGSSREAKRRRALCTPLAVFEAEADVRPGRDIIAVRDLRPAAHSLAIAASPMKSLQALFLAEVLDLLLRRAEADATLSDFLFASLEALAAVDSDALPNFHIVLLYRLTHFLGIEPDLEGWHPHAIFDLREARFRNARPLHTDYIEHPATTALMALARADYRSAARLPLDAEGRRTALDAILQYYAHHLTPMPTLRSLDILRGMA